MGRLKDLVIAWRAAEEQTASDAEQALADALTAARTPTRAARGDVVRLVPTPVDELLTDCAWDDVLRTLPKTSLPDLWQLNLDACLKEANKVSEIIRANRTQLPAPITRETA